MMRSLKRIIIGMKKCKPSDDEIPPVTVVGMSSASALFAAIGSTQLCEGGAPKALILTFASALTAIHWHSLLRSY